MPLEEPDAPISLRRAAALSGLSLSYVRSMAAVGRLRSVRDERHHRATTRRWLHAFLMTRDGTNTLVAPLPAGYVPPERLPHDPARETPTAATRSRKAMTPDEGPDDWITLQRAAQLGGVSPRHLYKLTSSRRLRYLIDEDKQRYTTRRWLHTYLVGRGRGTYALPEGYVPPEDSVLLA